MKAIKAAATADLTVIQDLAHAIWPGTYGNIVSSDQLDYMLKKIYSVPSLTHQMDNEHHHFIIIYEDEKAVGFADYSPKANEPSIYRLNKIYVLQSQQGTGTGKLLLNYVIDKAKKAGAVTLELNVNRYNKAKAFYEKQGFSVYKEEDIDIGNGYFMNDYVMRLSLA